MTLLVCLCVCFVFLVWSSVQGFFPVQVFFPVQGFFPYSFFFRSIDLKEVATGFDAFGSAATDVSAISLKSTGCQKEHIYFNQNAETSVAAEPNASQPVAKSLKCHQIPL